MTSSRIFISHTQDDQEFARELATALRIGGIDASAAWELPLGVPIDDELQQKIGEASAYVALVSERTLLSPWILFELGAALGGRKSLFLVLLTERAGLDLPPSLRRRSVVIDAKSLRPSEVADRILQFAGNAD